MPRAIVILGAVALAATALAANAYSRGSPQTLPLMRADPQPPSTAYRTSKVAGGMAVNEAGETVVAVNDRIVTGSNTVPFAGLPAGGVLGIGSKDVVTPHSTP